MAQEEIETYLFKTSAEPFKHSLHISSFFHGYDPRVVLLIDPDQKVLLIVVPETIKRAEYHSNSKLGFDDNGNTVHLLTDIN